MKEIQPGFQARLEAGATTLCWCWRIARRNGERLGFTDHDSDIVFDGTSFEAASGFTASEIRESVGLSVDNLEIEGALDSARLSEVALAAGDFDDAAIEIFRVDWTDPAQRMLMRRGSLGEVRRSGSAFVAEVRGLAHYLQQSQGRVFQFACDAELGDQRCGIDIGTADYSANGNVVAPQSDRSFTATGLSAFSDGWFTRGLLTFTSGTNAGRAGEVKRHAVVGSLVTLELWQSPGAGIASGDAFTISAGCDKQFATCRAKFANAANYRGFPHMPGNDFIAAPIRRNDS